MHKNVQYILFVNQFLKLVLLFAKLCSRLADAVRIKFFFPIQEFVECPNQMVTNGKKHDHMKLFATIYKQYKQNFQLMVDTLTVVYTLKLVKYCSE